MPIPVFMADGREQAVPVSLPNTFGGSVGTASADSELDGQLDYTTTTDSLLNTPPPPEPPPPKKPFPWRFAALAAVSLLMLGGLVFLVLRAGTKPSTPPNNAANQSSSSLLSVDVNQTLLIQGNLRVEGMTNLQDLFVHGDAVFDKNLNVAGNGTFGGTLTAKNFVGDGSGLTNLPIPPSVSQQSNLVFLNPASPQSGNISITGTMTSGNVSTGTVTANNISTSTITASTINSGSLTLSNALGIGSGGTGATTAAGALANLGGASRGTNSDITSTTALNTITPNGALTIGSSSQSLTLQGTAITLLSSNSGFTTQVGFSGTSTANVVYNFDRTVAAGTYDICTTIGNCGSAINFHSTAAPPYLNTDNSDGNLNIAIGVSALLRNTSGSSNIALGPNSLGNNDTGINNVAINEALLSNTSGSGNIGIGASALQFNTTGDQNIAIGQVALGANTIGGQNIALGVNALNSNTTGSWNIGLGLDSLRQSTTASNNIALGQQALFNNTSGDQNIAIGTQALLSNSTGALNIAIGTGADVTNGAQQSIAIGVFSRASCSKCLALGGLSSNAVNVGINNDAPASRLELNDLNTADSFAQLAVGTNGTGNKGIVVQGVASQSADLLQAQNSGGTVLASIDAAGNLTFQSATINGTLISNNSGFTTQIGFSGTSSANVVYDFDRSAAAGTYDICTSIGNCAASLGGVGSPGGSTNKIAKFLGAQTIGDSTLSDDGSTVTASGSLIVQGSTSLQGTTIATGNANALTVTSDLSGGARSTYPVVISQANNATNNSSVGLLNLTNSDNGSTAALLNVDQSASSGTGILVTSNNGTGITLSAGTNAGSYGINFTNIITSGTAISLAASGLTSGNGILIDGASFGPSTGFTGSALNISPFRALNAGTGASLTDSGSFINATRANVVNNTSGATAYTMSGALALLQSNCTVSDGGAGGADTCTDTSNILKLNQQYANAQGAVLKVTNSGIGDSVFVENGTGTIATIGNNGNAMFRTTFNTTQAFLMRNASSATLFNADTANMRVGVDVTYAAMTSPTIQSMSTNATGGTLTANTYYYKVTAIDANGGETSPSAQGSTTTSGSTSTVTVTWAAISGASGYHIYRSTTSGIFTSVGYYSTLGIVAPNPSNLTFTDTGSTKNNTDATPPVSTSAYVSTNISNASLALSIGGNGTPTGQLYVSGTVPSNGVGIVNTADGAYGIAVSGRYAYIVGQNGLTDMQIIDVSNPASPTVISSVGAPGQAIAVQGHYAYTAGSNLIRIFDVSNPASPTTMSSTTFGTTLNSISVQGRYMFVVDQVLNKLSVFDISNPASPINIASATTNSTPNTVFIQGRYAYLATGAIAGNGSLQIFDISNPASPSSVGSLTISGAPFINPYAVSVQGRYAYLLNQRLSNLQIIDVSNPATPVSISTVATGSLPISVFTQGRYAYVANFNGPTPTLQTIDISNPATPFTVGSVNTDLSGNLEAVYVQGRYAYVGNTNKMQIFDLGGTYTQQLEAGGAEFGTLAVDSNANFAGDTSVQGGLSVGQSIQTTGNLGVNGSSLFQGSISLAGGIQGGATINGISTPGTPTVTTVGTTGSTTWSYKIVAVSASGGLTPASAAGSTTGANGNATLTGSNYQQISWSAVTGAVSYKIYRTAVGTSPSTTGLIGTTSSTSFNDTGLAGDSSTASSTDASGQLALNGLASQTWTNTSSAGGTFNGYNQAITVSNTSSASTTNGINIALNDTSSVANTNTGLKVALTGGTGTTVLIGVDSNVVQGIALRGVSTGAGGATTCGTGGLQYSSGVCGASSAADQASGVMGVVYGNPANLLTSNNAGAGVFGYASGTAGTSGDVYVGVKGVTNQTGNGTYTSVGVYGRARGGFNSSIYGGYFELDSASNTTLGSALFASNSTAAANILQLQDNTTDVFKVADGGLITMQPAASLTSGQIGVTQTANMASTTGGTVRGYQFNSTIVNTSFPATDIGFEINQTDNTASQFNTNTGLKIRLAGSNASQIQLGIDSSVTAGTGILGVSSGPAALFTGCTSLSISSNTGVCGNSTYNNQSDGGVGVYGETAGGNSNLNNARAAGVVGVSVATGTAGGFYAGVKGITIQNAAAAYTSAGVYGTGAGGAGAAVYGGYFELINSTSSLGSALYASNNTKTANILQLQDNTTDVFKVADGGLITMQPAASLTAGQTHITQTLTNASSTGGTIQGYSQTITVSNTSSASTTNGINVSLTDNAVTLANTNTGLKVTLAGSNTSQGQFGADISVTRGIGLKAVSSGQGPSVSCAGVNLFAAGICADAAVGSGVYGRSATSGTSLLTLAESASGVAGINTSNGASNNFGAGVFGSSQNGASSMTGIGVYGDAMNQNNGTIYGGYFTVHNANTTSNGAVLTAVGVQPASVAGNGNNAVSTFVVSGGQGGNSSGTTSQVGGTGAGISITAGKGGDVNGALGIGGAGGTINLTSGQGGDGATTNTNGGLITIQGGAPGAGAGSAAKFGNIALQNSGGNVGVGTSTPTTSLSVKEEIGIGVATNSSYTTPGFTNVGILFKSSGGAPILGSPGAEITYALNGSFGADLLFVTRPAAGTNAAERLRISADGNVGIGTVSAGDKLVVAGGIHTNASIATTSTSDAAFDFNNGGARITVLGNSTTQGTFRIETKKGDNTNLLTPFFINTSGNIGINNTAPTQGNLAITQIVNGDSVIYAKRNTDTSPTGNFLQLQSNGGADLAKISVAGDLTVKSATINGTLTVNGHLITGNTTGSTTVAANTAVCGTGCTVTISGNDTSGVITVNTGTGVTAGTLGTVTFAAAYGSAPNIVITPKDVPASSTYPQYYYGSNTTTFDLKSYNAITDSQTYTFSYHIEQ